MDQTPSETQSPGVPQDDPPLHVKEITYPGETGDIHAHYARPTGEQKHPGVIVIHENRGLNPHIRDVAERVASQGFVTVAPDALSPVGGTPEDADDARALIQQLDTSSTINNFIAAVQYLKTHPQTTGTVGVMGFCWGGGMTNQVAVHSPDVQAAAPFYGRQPTSEDVPKITSALLLHYAERDERINAGIPAFEAALKEAAIEYDLFIYKGTQHAFFNDTGPRYHEAAAKLAWNRTITFFKEKLTS
jgi:carboxymethylenebutenolidase